MTTILLLKTVDECSPDEVTTLPIPWPEGETAYALRRNAAPLVRAKAKHIRDRIQQAAKAILWDASWIPGSITWDVFCDGTPLNIGETRRNLPFP